MRKQTQMPRGGDEPRHALRSSHCFSANRIGIGIGTGAGAGVER
jgi:hypothetical protein